MRVRVGRGGRVGGWLHATMSNPRILFFMLTIESIVLLKLVLDLSILAKKKKQFCY